MLDVLNQYFQLLWSQFQWDVAVMSQPWMYWWACVPAAGFCMFFVFKWMFLTAPILAIFAGAANIWKFAAGLIVKPFTGGKS